MNIFGFEVSRTRPAATAAVRKRDFAAAKISNLHNDWTTSLVNLNSDIQSGLNTIRARTRDRAKNSAWFRRYIETSQRNIVGPNGIRLNMRAKNPDGRADRYANAIIEAAWYDWSRKVNCTPAGTLSWLDVQLLAVQSLKVDGEFFFKLNRGAGKHRFSLSPIDAALCDVNYCKPGTATANEVQNGVELDRYGKPVAYYFQSHVDYLSGIWCASGTNMQRIPANEIIHGFVTEGPGQVRGFPDAVGILTALHMLDKYSEAEVTAARLAACKMGFYANESGAAAQLGDDKDGSDLVSEAEPGVFQLLPNGVKFQDFDPKHPTANYAAFKKAQLQEISAGVKCSYPDFANDLEGVSYSSIRSGTIAEQEAWKMQQSLFIEHLHQPVFEAWLEMFLLSGVSTLPMGKYDKFSNPNWLPRRWQWVDPLKDAEANVVMRNNGWKSDQMIVAEQGNDLDEIMEDIAAASIVQDEAGFERPAVDNTPKGKEPAPNEENTASPVSNL